MLESPQRGDSNKYPKHLFYEEMRIKQGLSNISFCPLRNLYNSKFVIMATSLGKNVVVVTRVHCKEIAHREASPFFFRVEPFSEGAWRAVKQTGIQSTLVISKSRGLSEILKDIRISTYQIYRIEEKIN